MKSPVITTDIPLEEWRLILDGFRGTVNGYILEILYRNSNKPTSIGEIERRRPAGDTRRALHAFSNLAGAFSIKFPKYSLRIVERRRAYDLLSGKIQVCQVKE